MRWEYMFKTGFFTHDSGIGYDTTWLCLQIKHSYYMKHNFAVKRTVDKMVKPSKTSGRKGVLMLRPSLFRLLKAMSQTLRPQKVTTQKTFWSRVTKTKKLSPPEIVTLRPQKVDCGVTVLHCVPLVLFGPNIPWHCVPDSTSFPSHFSVEFGVWCFYLLFHTVKKFFCAT
jgi:hypothetical protein